MGVFAPLVGVIGSLQAAEALKLIVGIGGTLVGRLQMLDARTMEWTEIARRSRSPLQRLRRSLHGDRPNEKGRQTCRPFARWIG